MSYNQAGVQNCGSLCTNKGRYCMTDPDFDTKAGVSGSDVVKESLRQKCVWNLYGGQDAPLKDQVGTCLHITVCLPAGGYCSLGRVFVLI